MGKLRLVSILSFLASTPTLYFLATFSIILIIFGIFVFFASDSCQLCSTQSILASSSIIGNGVIDLCIISSTIFAHLGFISFGARYFLSHIICIASNLASRSGIPSPPWFLSAVTSCHLIYPFVFPSHRKFLICIIILL